ncbi:SH3 domain-containing protein [Actibacterium lipolyticum]|uniref:Bacterial SH3 domain protein n=1 Tax=Actibacterium lipolyticum TaxID=1524263 RepID=A0A238JK61_9RHOB|nr:SH3 domain-containing protein [Actibacterium lipolyticum]SMX30875.1 Bacterial SH3 domain protein [Actibacterium lipolyticum]
MFRMSFWLCASLFAVMSLTDKPATSMQAASFVPTPEAPHDVVSIKAEPVLLADASAVIAKESADAATTTDASISKVSFGTAPTTGLVEVVSRDAPQGYTSKTAPTAKATAPASDGQIVAITGSRVNLRAGPSTNESVVGQLTRGTKAEVVGRPANGWVELKDLETGLHGFMAERFTAPAS